MSIRLGSGRALATLVTLAAALAAAFVVAPPALAGVWGGGFADERQVTEAARQGFVEYWRSRDRGFPPDLARVVDYWFRYHVAKGAIAALLLFVFVALRILLGNAFLAAGALGAGRRAAFASAGVLVTMLALFSLATVMANIQGAIAPFASLVPMLTDRAPDRPLADTLSQVRQQLAGPHGAGGRIPPLDVMVSDFSRYHVTMAAVAATVTVVLLGLGVASWMRFATTGSNRRRRSLRGAFGVLSVLLSLVVAVVAVANATTAADPAPALLAAFNGGW